MNEPNDDVYDDDDDDTPKVLIEGSDWSDVIVRKDVNDMLCKTASGRVMPGVGRIAPLELLALI